MTMGLATSSFLLSAVLPRRLRPPSKFPQKVSCRWPHQLQGWFRRLSAAETLLQYCKHCALGIVVGRVAWKVLILEEG